MTPEEFRAQAHAIVDWIADYRRDIAKFPVMAQTAPGQVRSALPQAPPDQPEAFAEIMRDLDAIIVPGISHWQHPSFFGYFPANSLLSSVLGDFLSTGLGVIGLSGRRARRSRNSRRSCATGCARWSASPAHGAA